MKTSIVILLFLFTNYIFGQSVPTDHILFQYKSDSTGLFYERHGIKDTNSLVIVISRSGLWTYGQYTDIFIFSPNKKPIFLEIFESSNLKMTKSFKKKHRLKGACLDSFREIIKTNNFVFNIDSLKVMPEPIIKDSMMTLIPTWDGLVYSLGIIKGSSYSHFITTSPEIIIRTKSVGYKEKEEFLTLIEKFYKIKNCWQHSPE